MKDLIEVFNNRRRFETMKERVPMNERDRSSFSVNIRKRKILEYHHPTTCVRFT